MSTTKLMHTLLENATFLYKPLIMLAEKQGWVRIYIKLPQENEF